MIRLDMANQLTRTGPLAPAEPFLHCAFATIWFTDKWQHNKQCYLHVKIVCLIDNTPPTDWNCMFRPKQLTTWINLRIILRRTYNQEWGTGSHKDVNPSGCMDTSGIKDLGEEARTVMDQERLDEFFAYLCIRT